MTTQELIREARSRLKRLSPEELRIVNAFLAFLESAKSDTLTREDRTAVESFKRAWTETLNGKIRPINHLQWSDSG